MTSADFYPIIPYVTAQDAADTAGRPVGQISPDKSMNFHYTTPAFTVAPELGKLSGEAFRKLSGVSPFFKLLLVITLTTW